MLQCEISFCEAQRFKHCDKHLAKQSGFRVCVKAECAI